MKLFKGLRNSKAPVHLFQEPGPARKTFTVQCEGPPQRAKESLKGIRENCKKYGATWRLRAGVRRCTIIARFQYISQVCHR